MSQETPPRWDLESIYPGLDAEAFREDLRRVREGLDALDAYLDAEGIGRDGPVPEEDAALAERIGEVIARTNALLTLHGTLRAYVHGIVTTDSYNTAARRMQSELEALEVRLERQEVRFRGWIGRVAEDPARLDRALATPGAAGEHAFYVRETAEQSQYLMPEAEEALAAELSLSGARAWERLRGVVTSQLQVPFSRDGQEELLPITVVQGYRTHPDGALRRQGYEVEMKAWESVQEPLAACLNGIKGTVITLNRRRGREDALHEALDQARIDRETLSAMLVAMRDAFPTFRRYWQAKAKRLGQEALPWWDLFAPVGSVERRYPFGEARNMIVSELGAFHGRLGRFVEHAFQERWIDAEPRAGKRGGAFCMRVPGPKESRILCNYDGSLDEVLTLAHELGHAYHNECLREKTPLQRQTPMTLAETASIFNQTIMTDAVLARAKDPQEELAILEAFLTDAGQVVVDITSRYLFEEEVFARRAEADLSAEDLCDIMLRAQQDTYGDGLDPRHLNPYMWAWKPHYYSAGLSFYNFPYAFGLLFGLGLYARYREQGAAFLADYDALLASTGEARAADLAGRFGIDLRSPAFWEGSLQVVARRVDRYLEI